MLRGVGISALLVFLVVWLLGTLLIVSIVTLIVRSRLFRFILTAILSVVLLKLLVGWLL